VATPRSTAIALQTDEEIAALTAEGERAIASDVRLLAASLIDAGRRKRDPADAIASVSDRMIAGLADAMTAAYLLGGLRSMTAYSEATGGGKRRRFATGTYADVVNFLSKRLAVSDGAIDAIRSKMYASAAESFADASGAVVGEFRQAIDSAISQGANTQKTVDILRDRLASVGVSETKPFLIETIYRTEASLAYNAGRFETNQAPEIAEILWGYEYVTVGDDRVRPSHAALDGLRRPKEDPVWNEILPPNGYNCRCTVVEVFKDEAIATPRNPDPVVLEDGTPVIGGPDEGFNFNAAAALSGAV